MVTTSLGRANNTSLFDTLIPADICEFFLPNLCIFITVSVKQHWSSCWWWMDMPSRCRTSQSMAIIQQHATAQGWFLSWYEYKLPYYFLVTIFYYMPNDVNSVSLALIVTVINNFCKPSLTTTQLKIKQSKTYSYMFVWISYTLFIIHFFFCRRCNKMTSFKDLLYFVCRIFLSNVWECSWDCLPTRNLLMCHWLRFSNQLSNLN